MTTHVLRTLEVLHVRSVDKIPRLLDIPTANRPAPVRAHIVAVGLQYVLFTFKVRVIDSATDIADGNGKGAFPAGALSPWIRPLVLEG